MDTSIKHIELIEALRYAANYSPYYKDLFAKHSIDLSKIKNERDLIHLPTTSKEDLQMNNSNFLCVARNQIADWVTTSGTLGSPVTFGLSAKDLDRLAYNEMRSFQSAGVTSDDTIQLMVTMDKRFMAGLAYYEGCRKLGASAVRVGSGSPGLQLDSISRFTPTVLVAVPSFLINIMEYAVQHNIDIKRWSVQKIICIGEPIRDKNLLLNNLGKRILSFNTELQLYSTYASTEMSTAITECHACRGGHIPEDLIVIETLDSEGNPVHNGQPGEVTITTLGVEAMPMIRFRTGDMCVKFTEVCACGKATPRLSPIMGRKKQMIKYKGTTIYANGIYEILNGVNNVKDYLVKLENTEVDTDDVTIYVSVKSESGQEIETLKEQIRDQLRVLPLIVVINDREMRKLKFPEGSRKPIRLLDERG